MANNPIFDRALQHSRWPSLLTTLFLFFVFVVAGAVYTRSLSTVDSHIQDSAFGVLVIFGPLSFLVAILSAPISALMTCLYLPEAMTSSDFQVIRLTGLSRRKIMVGYLLTALYRLRLLWVLTFGMLVVLTLLLVHCFGVHDALFTMTGGAIGVSINWLAICTGLWASARWGKRWSALMVTLAITGVALLMSLGGLWYIGFIINLYLWWIAPLITLAISTALSVVFLHQAEKYI